MLKAKNISFYKIMTAGYISAEVYSALKPKTHFSELNINDCLYYSYDIISEIKGLYEDEMIYNALCGIEQMENCLFNNDNRPYILLESTLSSAEIKVKEFISRVGSKYFLLDYVFSSKKYLLTRAYITDDNIYAITQFVEEYENAFIKLYSGGEELSNTINNESMSYNDEYDTNVNVQAAIAGENSVSYMETESNIRRTIVPIDDNAVSLNNTIYKKFVVVLSKLTDEEFEPFKIFLDCQLSKVPVRTKNGIGSIDCQEFYVNYLFADDEKLLRIRNFGRKSVHDFNQIRSVLINHVVNTLGNFENTSETIQKVVDAVSEEVQKIESEKKSTLKDIIGDTQYTMLGHALHELTSELSVRASNGINNYHGDFIEDFVHKDKDIKSLKNIGRKTEEEIVSVIIKLKELASEAMSAGEISPEELQLMQYQMSYANCWDDFAYQYLNDKGHLPMFHIVENWLKGQKGREWRMLNSCCSIFGNNEKKSLDELAEENNLSRERCRQLCVKAIKLLHTIDSTELESSTINYSKIISNKNEWGYISDAISDKNLLELSTIKSHVDEENCNLSLEFCFLILSIVFEAEYAVVGRELISLPTRAKQKWSNTYLVKREYAEAFCFNDLPELIDETEENLTEDIEVGAEQLAIDTFFMAWNDFDSDKVSAVSDILSHILIQEFGKIPNDCFQFTLEGKKVVNATDIIYGILHENGNPMNIDDMFTKLEEVCPNRYKSSYSIKTLIMNDPRICMVGTANLVALLEWNHVKVGSIRDIIAQYLSKFDEPQQVADIVAYVQQFRDSSENSIRSTMGSGDQFVQFNGGLYGLKDKTYAAWYGIPEKRRSFALRVNDMESFLRDNMHFPFNNSSDSHEDSLYNWWRRVLTSDDLSEEQQEEIKRIQEQYKEYPTTRRDNEWNELYRKFKLFLQNYGRKPNGVNSHEKILRRWFEKSMFDFSEGNLSSSQEKMYIELCKLL